MELTKLPFLLIDPIHRIVQKMSMKYQKEGLAQSSLIPSRFNDPCGVSFTLLSAVDTAVNKRELPALLELTF